MQQLSGTTLAYMGDAVYEVLIREYLLQQGFQKVDHLHKEAIQYTSAVGQKKALDAIKDILSEKEMAIYKRGRNASSSRKAKNADIITYREATGLEALFGYLYLEEQKDRINALLHIITKESK
jgi:ribonuclease-3 family protein